MFLGSMFFMILIPLGFLLFLVWIIYAVTSKDRGEVPKDVDRGIRIARERYAKGEITKEEYEEMMKNLKET